jgi:formyl-CoA transferase
MDAPGRPPLEGLLVVDLSRVLAGPYAAMLLADLGARVIKIERPVVGDDTRRWGPPFAGPEQEQESTYFLSANCNKESLTLDLKDQNDMTLLRNLLQAADVVIENFRTGVMDRLGLGPATLERLNPRLVTLSITGFGARGPERDRLGYDQILQAEGGTMSFTGPEPTRPTKVGVPIADLVAGMLGAIGVLAALREREVSGKGQHVDTSLLAGQIAIHAFQGTRWLVAGEVPEPAGNHHPTVAPYGMFFAADRPVVIAVGNDDIWCRFAPLVGLEPDDERFVSNQKRVANRRILESDVESAMRARTADDWLQAFAEAGVPAGDVKTLDRVYASHQVLAEGLVREVVHSTLGKIRLPGPPLHFSRSSEPAHRAPPVLAEHSDALRAEFGTRAEVAGAATVGGQPRKPDRAD